MKIIKNMHGITLVALVVTIIVLIILAGVSMNLILGENGIITKTKDAKEKTDMASKIEQEQLDNLDSFMNEFVDIFDENKNVNKPKLTTGMVPVNYNTTNKKWEQCLLEDWDWNYEEQISTTESGGTSKWANAMTDDGSLWVWIPRYAYRIKSGYHTSTVGEIDVVFLVGATNKDKDGNEYKTSYNMTEATTNGYMLDFVVHPAFGDKLNQGGWSHNIPGFWVAKFEAGFVGTENANSDPNSIDYTNVKDSTVVYTSNKFYDLVKEYGSIYEAIVPNETFMKYPVFKENVFSYVELSIGDAFGLAKSLNAQENPYGFTQNCNTHMMKNSEWGAVAYLTHSKYGRNKTEVTINNFLIPEGDGRPVAPVTAANNFCSKTGYSSIDGTSGSASEINTTLYNEGTGYLSSTTGNIYGVYDLNGGAYEHVAAYCDTLNTGTLNSTYGSAQPMYDEYGSYFISETNKKYKQFLSRNLEQTTQASAWLTHNNIFGDAMWEISLVGNNAGGAWNSDRSRYPYAIGPFVFRGGGAPDANQSGIFSFACGRGSLVNTQGFRACVVVPD